MLSKIEKKIEDDIEKTVGNLVQSVKRSKSEYCLLVLWSFDWWLVENRYLKN